MHLAETAYDMPTGMLLHEAGRQFAMVEIVRDGLQQALYERGGWFLLLVHAERTCGVVASRDAEPDAIAYAEQAMAEQAEQKQRKAEDDERALDNDEPGEDVR